MINLSPGLLYSAQKLIEIVSSCPMDRDQYLWSFRTILVSPAEGVLILSTRCGWIGIDEKLSLDVTEMGRKVQELPTVEGKLRQQIKDYIQAVQPSWAKLLSAGRAESLPFMPPPARQCFYEAALDGLPAGDEVVEWWDDLAAAARGRTADYLAKVGRDGERCSIRYEEDRVGRRPEWHSIESNKSGYDLLSITTSSDPVELQIEVKASQRPILYATFHVSRNEWEAAENAQSYVFHLWSLTPTGKSLAVLTPDDVAAHVPAENGAGRWESTEIPYRVFDRLFKPIAF
jgi:hypothetical protein